MRPSSVYLPLILAICLLAITGRSVQAGEDVPRFIRVPVFFITDRNMLPGGNGHDDVKFGGHRKYVGECKHDPFMGTAWCVVENVEGKALTPTLKDRLGWTAAAVNDKPNQSKATLLDGSDFASVQARFFSLAHQQAASMADKNLFVFAHGYKNSFESGLHTAARLAYNAERPLIYYSWPSVAALRSYTSDENNVEWSQEHYNDMLTKLESLYRKDHSLRIRLFAHSMGSRLMVRAAPVLDERKAVEEFTLICPDIDAGLVKHYARRYLRADGTTVIRLYMSRRDKALAISQLLHGGYARLGECADSLSNMVGQILASDSQKGSAKSAEEAEFQSRLEASKKRMQTIDFTRLDTGLVGHKIPAKLICSMSFTGTAGDGLRLVPEESGKRSKTSKFFSKLTRLQEERLKEDMGGNCLLVEYAETGRGKIARAASPATR